MLRTTAIISLSVLSFISFGFAKDKDRYQQRGPVRLDRDGEKWAERTLKKMSVEEKVGQMIMVWSKGEFVNVNSPKYLELRDTMLKYHLGGFGFTVPVQMGFLLKTEPYEAAALINQLQRDSRLPLIFAADFERGLPMRTVGGTAFPHAMAFGAAAKPEFAEAFGRITAQEARAIGVEWNWFPDADVNSNPLNPIINTRSFGEDPKQVSDLVTAYIKGAHEGGMLTTAKHFPGHGDTATDSHQGLATVNGDRNHLETIELPPFRAAIYAGVDSVMIAHVTVPALDNGPNRVATNSPLIVTELLKKAMGFKGLVVTDALSMNGLMRIYASSGQNPSAAAAVATVKAGNDMVIIPMDVDGAYNGLLRAAKSGEIPQAQIDASVLKILKAKASVGLHKARLVNLEEVDELVQDPKNVALAQQVADQAVTLVRDNGKLLPLRPTPKKGETNTYVNPYTTMQKSGDRLLALIFTDDVRSDWGRQFEYQLRQRVPDVKVIYIDPDLAPYMANDVVQKAAQAQSVIAAVYAVPSAGKAMNDPTAVLKALLDRAGDKTVVVAMGSPYVASGLPVQNYVCTFSNTATSENSAVRALFGEVPIRGRLPVSIPGLAQRGTGIDHPVQLMQGGLKSHGDKRNANP